MDRRDEGRARRMPLLTAALAASLATTEALLAVEGEWKNALPLHLCGLSALAALAVALGARGWALDFLWYPGMPGALLALLFPAPAASRYQALLDASYVATHALILAVPLRALRLGARPRPGRAADMLLLMQGMALAAFFVNRALGTDYLFLMGPPPGTPLTRAYALGYPAYLLCLQALLLAACLLMQAVVRRLNAKTLVCASAGDVL